MSVSKKDATIEIANATHAQIKFMPFAGSMYIGILAMPGPTAANALIFIRPTNKPPIKLEATTAPMTFLCCSVTPYSAGSVMPNRPEIPAEIAVERRFSSLVLMATARQAPPSEILCANDAGRYSISKPGLDNEDTAYGTSALCIPNEIMNGRTAATIATASQPMVLYSARIAVVSSAPIL